MLLITDAQRQKLLANGARRAAGENIDPQPVVKLFTPDANATWLLTDLAPSDPDLAFGLCDLGLGSPELGTVRLSQLVDLRGRAGLPVERDVCFQPNAPLSGYAAEARRLGRIHA